MNTAKGHMIERFEKFDKKITSNSVQNEMVLQKYMNKICFK